MADYPLWGINNDAQAVLRISETSSIIRTSLVAVAASAQQ
jgi:hypothetical protein